MKRKIRNFNDFMRCIKAFKKVTSDFGYWTYFLSDDGYICKISDNLSAYNIPINGRDLEDMEVEEQEQEPIKICVGKFYKTRNGKKAYCFYKDKEDKLFPNHFVIEGESGCETYRDDGSYFKDEESGFDIVDYWE